MPLRLEITPPRGIPREVPLLPGRTRVVASPAEQYRLLGDAGEIPATVRVLRVGNALVVTGLPDGQDLELGNFFGACRPGSDCTLQIAAPGGPEVAVGNESPPLAALRDGSFLLAGPAAAGDEALPVADASGAGPGTGGGGVTRIGVGLLALLGLGAVAGGGGGGGDGGGSTAVAGTTETVPGGTGSATTPAAGPGGGAAGGGTPPPVPGPDTTAPTLAITDDTAGASTNRPVTFTFTFSETVDGFAATDVVVAGGTAGALTAAGDGRTWTMTVTPTAGVQDGRITVDVAAGAATDIAGNASAAAPRGTQAYDTRGPGVTVTDDTAAAVTGRPVVFRFAFDEPVTGFDAGDIAVAGGTAAAFAAVGDGRGFSVTVTPAPDVPSGQITVDVPAGAASDALGNASAAATRATQAIDTVAPAQRVGLFAVLDDRAPSTGLLPSGATTNDTTPGLTLILDGPLAAGDTLTLARDGATIGTLRAGATLTVPDGPVPAGPHVYAATIVDAAGNLSTLDLNGVLPGTGFPFAVA